MSSQLTGPAHSLWPPSWEIPPGLADCNQFPRSTVLALYLFIQPLHSVSPAILRPQWPSRTLPFSFPEPLSERDVSPWRRILRVLILFSSGISLSSSQLIEAPSALYLSSNISLQIHISAPPTLQKRVIFLLVEFQIYFLTSQAEFVSVQSSLIDIQLSSRNQMKWGPLLFCHLAPPKWDFAIFSN